MQKEELLSLLGVEARAIFGTARHLALVRGGCLSPLHLLVALLEAILSAEGKTRGEAGRLLAETRENLATTYPAPGQSITVPRETQSVIAEAGRLARAEGLELASPLHLLRASLACPQIQTTLGSSYSVGDVIDEASAWEAAPLEAERRSSPGARVPLTGVLADYCTDLTEDREDGSTHPFVGREREITAVLETLCRKLKNNPLLIGKPGVGKTALVVAVAKKLSEGRVPLRIRGKRILEVSRLRLLADAKYSGDIEERLKKLLEEVRRAGDVILFFDEIHTLLSAGGSGGTGDVANLLKSALSKGEITCIGATTLAEYYKYVARDEALARRFSTLTIDEPSVEETLRILKETRASFESYHGVTIGDDIIAMIVEMADRFLQSRSFPDKAFDLVDKAAAKATLAGHDLLTRDCVTESLSETTGLPLEIMHEDQADRLARLETFLNGMVPGQQRAVRDVSRVVKIAKLGLELRPETPDGVFLFVGPEGVGKHEMAMALAKFLYGSTNKMIEFDMSQFSEIWSMSRLVGAEPGYVGYGDRSGLLSKAAEDNPHAVLYFKNIDVAHPVVQQFLGEAFEQGRFTDATGARISLSNTTVVMSLSHVGESSKSVHLGFAPHENHDERNGTGTLRITGSLNLRERGSAFGIVESLAGAIDEVIEFQVLDRGATEQIIAERLEALSVRLQSAQAVDIKMDENLTRFFADKLSAERKSLAQLERLLQDTIILPFTALQFDRSGARHLEVTISVENDAVRVVSADSGS
jgi:ATP-dependent Clp protease ATP-binding subunit ClpA